MSTRRIDAPKIVYAAACQQSGQGGCNAECYHAQRHEFDDSSCYHPCPLVKGAACGGRVKNA